MTEHLHVPDQQTTHHTTSRTHTPQRNRDEPTVRTPTKFATRALDTLLPSPMTFLFFHRITIPASHYLENPILSVMRHAIKKKKRKEQVLHKHGNELLQEQTRPLNQESGEV